MRRAEVEITEAGTGSKWTRWIDVPASNGASVSAVKRAARKQMIAELDRTGYQAAEVEVLFVEQSVDDLGDVPG